MNEDLVKRLRALHVWPQSVAREYAGEFLTVRQVEKLYCVGTVAHEAADAIERLQAQLAEARAALEKIADEEMVRVGYDQTDIGVQPVLTITEMQATARAALTPDEATK